MSFSSLLEEANHTLESDGDTQWSIDSNSSNTLPSPLPLHIKHEKQANSDQNCGKQTFVNTPGIMNNVHNQNFNNMNDQVNLSRQFTSYHVKAEPNPFYNQNGFSNTFTHQLYQQPFVHQRTHLPIQFEELYNTNSIQNHQFVANNINNNYVMLQDNYHKPLSDNISSPNLPVEKSRKRANKKATPRKKVKIELKGPPPNWRPLYDNIMEMRKSIVAPVDVMGCFKNAQSDKGPKIYRYQVMISLMLSSQTKDEVTAGAMRRLKNYGLDPKHISQTEESVLAQLIHPVGFWQKKAGYIKNASRIVHTEYGDEIPQTVEGLTSLPGIGPKMAHLCMEFAWDKLTGISVDTHVHRICQRLGWTPTGIRNPDDTRKLLEHWLPKEEWGRINLMMVGFGQVTCLPTKPRCFECKNKDICPYAISNPDRTARKSNQSVRPSARDLKDSIAEPAVPGVKTEIKVETVPKSEKTEALTTSCITDSSCMTHHQAGGYQTPLLTPPLQHPTQEFSVPQSLRCKMEPHPSYQYSPTVPPPSYPTPLGYTSQQPGTANNTFSSNHPTGLSYHNTNMKLELIQSPEQIYQTLTPSASPHDATHAPPYSHLPGASYPAYPPGVYYNNGAYHSVPEECIQSPMVDTTSSCSSPLINPLISEENAAGGSRLSHGLGHLPPNTSSDNVLDNFLDW